MHNSRARGPPKATIKILNGLADSLLDCIKNSFVLDIVTGALDRDSLG